MTLVIVILPLINFLTPLILGRFVNRGLLGTYVVGSIILLLAYLCRFRASNIVGGETKIASLGSWAEVELFEIT